MAVWQDCVTPEDEVDDQDYEGEAGALLVFCAEYALISWVSQHRRRCCKDAGI